MIVNDIVPEMLFSYLFIFFFLIKSYSSS